MGVSRRLKVFRHLHSPSDVFLALRILIFAVGLPILLRLKLTRLATLLEPKNAPSTLEPAGVQKIVSYVEGVLRVGRPLIRPGCLTRGVTLYYFLRRAGLDVSVCFGMGSVGGEFVGHCWLVKDQEPFLESRDPRPLFTKMYSFPEEHRSVRLGRRIKGGYRTDETP